MSRKASKNDKGRKPTQLSKPNETIDPTGGRMTKGTIYRWVYDPRGTTRFDYLHNVGILADGTLHNPNGYSPDIVRQAVEAANAHGHLRRSEATKRAGKTRAVRREKRVAEAAKCILAGIGIGEATRCQICLKDLSDPESIKRGIGPECWQDVLALVTEKKEEM
jgi:hypothetical protein